MKRQLIMLTQLTCPSCAAKVEQAATRLPGMQSAKVAFGSGTLHVQYDETQLTEAAIRKLVEQQGLGVAMILNAR